MTTQADIARVCGLDVSSVNKILNHKPGAVFHKDTIRLVEKTAKKMRYRFSTRSRGELLRILNNLFPKHLSIAELSILRSLDQDQVLAIKATIGTV